MDNDTVDRIKKIIAESGLNQKEFCEYCSISPSTLSGVLKGKGGVTLPLVMSVHNAFPKYTLDWLLKGADLSDEVQGVSERKSDSSDAFVSLEVSSSTAPILTAQSPQTSFAFGSALTIEPNMPMVPSATEMQAKAPSESPEMVKYIERPPRQVVEIRVFFDDGTYQVLTP